VGPIAVTGPMTDAEFAAHLPLTVTGEVLVDVLTPLPVSGPLTDAQLAARLPLDVREATSPLPVDASFSTVPISADSLPLPDGAATEASTGRAADSLDDVALTAILEREKVEA